MSPAQAMGTFLRVWRSEWAELSRAQLATLSKGTKCVRHVCGRAAAKASNLCEPVEI